MEPNIHAEAQIARIDNEEKDFLNFLNFSEEMYQVLQDDDENQLQSHCMHSMDNVGQSYRMVHGYISLLVCIAGILMNLLIIMVLTRKEMRTPINRMLTALAIADIVVMIEYIPFTLHMYVFDLPKEQQYTYLWAVYVLIHSHLTQILHTINIQLTISMSIWRYVALKGTGKSSSKLTLARCNICILAAYICPIIICIPNYLTFSIYHRERLYLRTPYDLIFKRQEVSSMSTFLKLCEHTGEIMQIPIACEHAIMKQDWYTVGLSKLAKANNELLHRVNFWTFSVFVKLIPCVVLTTFMVWLVKTLYDAKKRHKMLQERKSNLQLTSTKACNHRENFVQQLPTPTINPPSDEVKSPTTNHRNNSLKDRNLVLNNEKNNLATNINPTSAHSKDIIISTNNGNGVMSDSPRLTIKNNCNSDTNYLLPSSLQQQPSTDQLINDDDTMTNNKSHREQPWSRRSLTRMLSSNSRKESHKVEDGDNQQQPLSLSASFCSAKSINMNEQDKGTISPSRMSLKSSSKIPASTKKSGKKTDRTSKLLIAVLCLFLITEIPQGIMALLSSIYGEQFFRKCYSTWAEVWDILALINSAINFILYCFMSKQFRLQFSSIFKSNGKWKCCCCRKDSANGPTYL